MSVPTKAVVCINRVRMKDELPAPMWLTSQHLGCNLLRRIQAYSSRGDGDLIRPH